jgi:hypothetical protein
MRGIIFIVCLLSAALAAHVQFAPALAQQEQKVLASAEYSDDPNLRCDLLEVKRVSGGALNIRWRVVNTTAGAGGLTGASGKPINYNYSYTQLYFIDPAENKKYSYLTDSAGGYILQIYEGTYAPGQQRSNWAKFPAPPASSKKITIYIPKFTPFDDIPISE